MTRLPRLVLQSTFDPPDGFGSDAIRVRMLACALLLCVLCAVAIGARSQAGHGEGRKICDLRHLAVLVNERYSRPGFPIATYEVLGVERLATRRDRRTFVVVAQGITNEGFWNYWLAQIARNYPADAASPDARPNSGGTATSAGNSYANAILGATDPAAGVPPGSNLILVGHSLGAIEHQNLVRTLKERGFAVPYVVTFGAPIVARPDPGTLYRYVKADLDLIAAADRIVAGDASVIRISGGSADPFDLKNGSHHIYGKSAALEQLDIFGDRKTSSSACLEIDALTRREYAVPGLDDVAKAERPANVYVDCANCFWAAIATDLGTAIPRQKLMAAYGTEGTMDEQVERTLKAVYGPDPTGDRLGPGRQRAHREGKPVPSSVQAIEKELRDAGIGSRGLVFAKGPIQVKLRTPGQPDRMVWSEERRVINVRCIADPNAPGGRRVEYHDAQVVQPSKRDPATGTPRSALYPDPNSKLLFYRTL